MVSSVQAHLIFPKYFSANFFLDFKLKLFAKVLKLGKGAQNKYGLFRKHPSDLPQVRSSSKKDKNTVMFFGHSRQFLTLYRAPKMQYCFFTTLAHCGYRSHKHSGGREEEVCL